MKKKVFTLTKKDFDIQTFKSGGPGGQHQNKTDSGVRIIHKASGCRAESRSHKSQHANKKEAFKRLCSLPKFKLWINAMVHEYSGGKSIEERVNETIRQENIKVETRENGKWKTNNGLGGLKL